MIVGEQVAEKLLLGTPRGPVRGGTGDEIRKVWRGWMNQNRGVKTGDRVEGKEVVCLSEEWLKGQLMGDYMETPVGTGPASLGE